ncbi:Kelch repeat-containing protein [Actinomycetota bacterium]
MVYDPESGLVVLQTVVRQTSESGLVAYDVDTDIWTPIGAIEGEFPPFLIGHVAQTDQLGFLGAFGDDDELMVVDPRNGASTEQQMGVEFGAAGFGRLHYATGTDTPYVLGEDLGDEICRLNPSTLDWTCISLSDGPESSPGGVGLLAAIVGDPINDRLVLIYGYGDGFDGMRFFDVNDIWAIDFDTGKWTQLLVRAGEATQIRGNLLTP